MKRLALLLVSGVWISAQVVSIAAGSSAPVGTYAADRYFSGGTARPLDATIGAGIYQTTRFGTSFSYHIPVPPGFYSIQVRLSDPTSTGPGQRRFTIGVNGNVSAPIDLYALVGARTPYTLPLYAVAGAGYINLVFTSTVGNATVSGIDISTAAVAIGDGSPVIEKPCPDGWTKAKLADGNCMFVTIQ